MNIEKRQIEILNKFLLIDKVYTLDSKNGLYDKKELQKRQNNSFFMKIIKNK